MNTYKKENIKEQTKNIVIINSFVLKQLVTANNIYQYLFTSNRFDQTYLMKYI